jgi:hypothetical protein
MESELDYRRLYAQERAERLAQSMRSSRSHRRRRRQKSLLDMLRPAQYRRARALPGN